MHISLTDRLVAFVSADVTGLSRADNIDRVKFDGLTFLVFKNNDAAYRLSLFDADATQPIGFRRK